MPSYILSRCPSCHGLIETPAEFLGRECPCPGCGRPFVVAPLSPTDAEPSLLACRGRLARGGEMWPRRRRVAGRA
jgi:hypothetical protein